MHAYLVEQHRKAGSDRAKADRDKLSIAKAKEYLSTKAWEQQGKVVPTVEGLALYCGISRSACYENVALQGVMEELQTLQADLVINKSLGNQFNPAISKLILSAKHGYVERSQTENVNVNVEVGQPKPELAQGFADYLKQQTQALPEQVDVKTVDNKSVDSSTQT